ncbi:hypothetical protein M6D93_02270 [Jatrophihabitans telluris]|uniref:MaoC-like domain-containing protein n=1 Tax=Jatrophihabitans telluris TaxID=2038343 RepID=A0ABY4QZA4_9ACTN|nr:MaoC/PaaZ C-terminal domain-containing protein [Jatrophihabitans telluris]UQX88838.1 hypothetical protein M6D93_02270 [Jatrophihabitans telluris]
MTHPSRQLPVSPALAPLYARAVFGGRFKRSSRAPGAQRVTVLGQHVDGDRLAAYQRLCGFRVSDVVPPTYLHLVAFPLSLARMTEADFPFPVLGLVHVQNAITQFRPVRLGEVVDVEVWAADLRPHPAGQQIDLVSQASVDGQVVWGERSTYLRRGHSADRDRRTAGRADHHPASASTAPVLRWPVPRDIGRRYAAISGDRNPIHLHALTAKAFGFPRALAHGMWVKARALAAFEGRLPDSFTVEAAFKTPVFVGSAVEMSAEPSPDGWAFEVRDVRTAKPHLRAQLVAG